MFLNRWIISSLSPPPFYFFHKCQIHLDFILTALPVYWKSNYPEIISFQQVIVIHDCCLCSSPPSWHFVCQINLPLLPVLVFMLQAEEKKESYKKKTRGGGQDKNASKNHQNATWIRWLRRLMRVNTVILIYWRENTIFPQMKGRFCFRLLLQ